MHTFGASNVLWTRSLLKANSEPSITREQCLAILPHFDKQGVLVLRSYKWNVLPQWSRWMERDWNVPFISCPTKLHSPQLLPCVGTMRVPLVNGQPACLFSRTVPCSVDGIDPNPKRERQEYNARTSQVARGRRPRRVLTSSRVRHVMWWGNQIHSVILWTLGIPKMYMGTLGYNIQISL